MEFPYTPHTSAILRGRGMNQDGKLMCCASRCIFETETKGFGREIEVKGECECPNCKAKVEYPQDVEFDDMKQNGQLKCPACKRTIPLQLIKWTQWVISKHHRNKHLYYHKECHDAMYHDLPDDENDGES